MGTGISPDIAPGDALRLDLVVDARRLQRLIDAIVAVGSDLDLEGILKRIVRAASDLAGSRYGAVSVISADASIRRFVVTGLSAEEVEKMGPPPEGRGVLGILEYSSGPVRLRDIGRHPLSVGFPPGHPQMTSFLGVPILVRGEHYGRIYLADKIGADEFTDEDEQIVSALAMAAGVAIDHAELHLKLSNVALLEERERIARDLHDLVIQRIFAAGLMLQSAERFGIDPEAAERVNRAVDELDETIRQIRSTVFHLSNPSELDGDGLSVRLEKLSAQMCEPAGIELEATIDEAVNAFEGSEMEEHLAYSLIEALSNVVRHARAHSVKVVVSTSDRVVMRVLDDGIGIGRGGDGGGPGGMGLRNLRSRAGTLGGDCVVGRRPEGGTELVWTAKVPARERVVRG